MGLPVYKLEALFKQIWLDNLLKKTNRDMWVCDEENIKC